MQSFTFLQQYKWGMHCYGIQKTIQLSNWLPLLTNYVVVSSSRAEMFKKNEEFKMLGTTYPLIWCYSPDEQILQISVFSACTKWSMELSALREILLTMCNIKNMKIHCFIIVYFKSYLRKEWVLQLVLKKLEGCGNAQGFRCWFHTLKAVL